MRHVAHSVLYGERELCINAAGLDVVLRVAIKTLKRLYFTSIKNVKDLPILFQSYIHSSSIESLSLSDSSKWRSLPQEESLE